MNKKKKSSTFSNNLFIEKTTNVKDKNKENIKNALSINQNKSKSIIQPKLLKKKTEKINISSNSFKEIKSEVNTPHSKINLSIKLNNNEETLTKDDLSQLDSNICKSSFRLISLYKRRYSF